MLNRLRSEVPMDSHLGQAENGTQSNGHLKHPLEGSALTMDVMQHRDILDTTLSAPYHVCGLNQLH